jgi:hypothetical protein
MERRIEPGSMVTLQPTSRIGRDIVGRNGTLYRVIRTYMESDGPGILIASLQEPHSFRVKLNNDRDFAVDVVANAPTIPAIRGYQPPANPQPIHRAWSVD